ncbi:glycosyltransferase family 2 protein [Paenibacillus eucommiae]|uniref:Glycosyltransferase involved in cell wall biosynthesis n=1 Tax=Paenibacillus eucommiae TaxID=1355755 RepID=A0ABS4J753_9BACL|nr:glycosyltransferase [Paenibacillus eucommiae]MBP1995667.1 glycosyltransferase involved in cell wall biosynthesis [Paenibacillus eucommiae]
MNQPLVSVIIPTYNRPLELCELLESLWQQTYTQMQIIVVNDCGTPVDFIGGLYPELDIQVVNMEANLKHVYARNRGLQEARGSYIMLCDDDDLLLPTHLERMLAAIEHCDMVYTDVEIFDYEVRDGVRIPTSRFVFAYDDDLAGMRKFSTFFSSGCLFKRRIYDELGPFDTEMFHYWDWDFYLRAVQSYSVKRVPVASALYAFSSQADTNMSGQLDQMRPYLDKLSDKHQLGTLPTKNFFLLLDEPEVKSRQADTELLWDGEPFRSRLASDN